MAVRTNAIEEKATACRVLSLLVVDLHALLLPYLPSIMATLFPLLNRLPFDDIQMAALSAMPDCLLALAEALDARGVDAYQQALLFALDTLLEFLASEPELPLLVPALGVLDECLQMSVLRRDRLLPLLHAADLARLVEALRSALAASFERHAVELADAAQAEWDEEELEEFRALEAAADRAHFLIAQSLADLLAGYPHLALPLLDELLLPDLRLLADPSRRAADRAVALHVFAALVRHGGPDAFPYYPQCVPVFLRELHAPTPLLRQEAAAGLAAAAALGKDRLCEVAPRCVKEIELTLEDPVSRDPCYQHSNAVELRALGEICAALSQYLILPAEHYAFWLQRLPLADPDENTTCLQLLCTLLDRGEQPLLGEANQNLPRILQVLCDGLATADTELANHILRLLKSIQVQVAPELFEALWNVLGPEKAAAIQNRLAEIPTII